MDERTRLLTSAMKLMSEHGIVVLGTVASGIALGPEGALFGGLLAGAALGVSSLIRSPWWRRVATMLISNLTVLYPFLRERMHVLDDLLQYIAELLMRLLQRAGLIEGSHVRPLANRDGPPPPAC
uniref:Putative RNA polymerase II subunit B1 CTD phosphatase rpap2 n=1 Tax=Lygus hesperus TaxID=30085 RepID=A0A0A9YTI6_LYGHE